jgi:site-specific DNA-methyltransferase (adenine-specific)
MAAALIDQASSPVIVRKSDVLTCIANPSNDDEFTPPDPANWMLDMLAEAREASCYGANRGADKTVQVSPSTSSTLL